MDDEDSDDGFSGNIEEDYYTFLNVSKNATVEEINSAYRHLSRMYHPDKHVDIEKKTEAEVLFNRTKKAYEVLSDPHKRVIYDSLGVKGLETEGWEIVHRQRTPAEIREEYERLAREREERKLQQRTNPKGNITVSINAIELFDAYEDEFDERLFPAIEVSGMSISQSIEAPITVRDTVTMSGSLATQNGIGSGGFLISGRRLVNKGWIELDVGAGNGPVLGCKGSRTLTQKIFCNGGLNFNFRPNGIIPGAMGSLACQLNKHTIGYLTYNAGLQSSMSTVLEQNTEKHHWQVTLLIGVPHCFVSASYTRKMLEYELKLRVAAKAGTFGFTTEYGAEKKVSKYSSVVATVSLGVPSGVFLKLKLIRSSQTYIFPLHLSDEIIPAAVFYATVTPLIVWMAVKKVILEPMKDAQKQRDIEKAKETNKQRMAEKRREAESATDLMLATYERIRDDEEKRKGLIIIKAIYGKITTDYDGTSLNDDNFIDVTVPLQCLTKSSKLILHESSKSELPGFYDPCVGEEKYLKIDFIYREQNFSVTIADKEPLRIPLPSGISPTGSG